MLALIAAALLSQAAPAEPTAPPPPLPPPAAAAPLPPGPAEGQAFTAEFADRHLLSLDFGLTGLRLRDSERTWGLGEGDGVESAFALVPAAAELGRAAEQDFRVGRTLSYAGLGLSLAALVFVSVAPLLVTGAAVFPLLFAGLAAAGIALVLALVALPYTVSAQQRFLDAVSTFNHGLVRRIEVPRPQLPVPLAWVPRSDLTVFVE